MNNIVSKILIVANLVFSLCFMCFAGAVFTFQAGWRDKANKIQTQLASANDQVADLQGQNVQLMKTMTDKLKDETTRANLAEAKVGGLQQDPRRICPLRSLPAGQSPGAGSVTVKCKRSRVPGKQTGSRLSSSATAASARVRCGELSGARVIRSSVSVTVMSAAEARAF